jgi:hypothetical protein
MAQHAPFPDSDIQFVARMLRKTRIGDQVTRAEAHRLDEIADHGYTRGTAPPSDVPTVVHPDLERERQ